MAGKYLAKSEPRRKTNQAKPPRVRSVPVKKKEHHSSIPQIILSVLFFLVGTAVTVVTIGICRNYYDQMPILLEQPDAISSNLTAMMDAVCEGDYEKASQSILGTPDFGVDREASDEVGVLIWDAYLDSMTYELIGECHVADAGIAQDIALTYLDVHSVTSQLEQRAKSMMEQRVQEAVDVSEIYDENNEYREDFVMDILHDVTLDALREDAKTTTVTITVNLTYQDGQWWIVPEKAFLEAISCGVLS